MICRGSNNYGPYQYPEKLIPLMVLNALHGDRLPVYGDGLQVRNWIHVEDFARAIGARARAWPRPARSTTRADPTSVPNIEVVRRIIELTGASESLIEHVSDRPGHDRRYSLSSRRFVRWAGSRACASPRGSSRPSAWYRENEWWWEPIRSGDYRAYYERQYGRSLA